MEADIDLNTRMTAIKKQPLFSQLTDAEIEELANLLEEKRYFKGDVLVTEGDKVDSFFLIISGDADVRVNIIKDHKIDTQSVAVLKAGQAIGLKDRGFYSVTGLRTATVIALTDMLVLRMSTASFHGFALSHSHVSEIMHQNAVGAWDVKE